MLVCERTPQVVETSSRESGAGLSRPGVRSPGATNWLGYLLAPVDNASLLFFRVGFGLLMACWAGDYLASGRVQALYVLPKFHFSYWLFNWVQPWPGPGPYIHFVALLVLSLFVAAGLFYRASAFLLALGFTIFFLWDRTNYQNHYHLLLLISWMMVFVPANRACSIDAIQKPSLASPTAPRWALWLLRFHIALPYVFGGIAKLDYDWLKGAPMRSFLADKPGLSAVPWLGAQTAALAFAWGGLAFDLAVVPLLIWRPTRVAAFVMAVLFHTTNHFLFSIHVFPWFMIFASTLFFEPDWPRRLLSGRRLKPMPAEPCSWQKLRCAAKVWCCLAAVYLLLQVLLPFRHLLYAGPTGWHERGQLFAWRMMLRGKKPAVRFYLTDPATGETWHPNLRKVVSEEQLGKCGRDPEMVLHLAHMLAEDYRARTGHAVEVRALVLTSYNGRKPQLQINPGVDLAQEPRGFYRRTWVMPLTEPLRSEPWSAHVLEWERLVKLPPLPVVNTVRPKHG